MKVLCCNIDADFNLAMRKIYNYHLTKGDSVELVNFGFNAYKKHGTIEIDGHGYDKVYVSNIFENNADIEVIGCDNVSYGGVGSKYPLKVLSADIESIDPFYYEHEKISYGFMTRGCVRNCYFCKVPKTEGYIHFVRHPSEICTKEQTVFYDNNILGYKGHMDLLDWLRENNIKCQFNQGLDFRLTNDDNLRVLGRIRLFGDIIFAFDDIRYQSLIDHYSPRIFKEFNKPWRTKWYLYYNPKDPIEGLLSRIYWCKNHKALPYVMRDRSVDGMDKDIRNFITDVTAWANQPSMFKKMDFDEFIYHRSNNFDRIDKDLEIWENNNL